MLARRGTFTGASVFLSRSLVPLEVFDSLHDALRLNGAEVFTCCDPSRNSPNDYHIISSSDHEKFEDLRAKGCNLLGPQCIFTCAKEHRMFPKCGYTCCLAMDGVKVLASGFDNDAKALIEKQVTAMGGVLQAKTSMDVNFVIVKTVLSAKYRWALTYLKKPIVTIDWLHQCWIEHRVVPQEPYRVLPFTGLRICVTRLPDRAEIKRLISQNGGEYCADLSRKCSHLVSDVPNGDKYLVASRWDHIHIVNRKWLDHSISRRACLDERLYPVHKISTFSNDAKVVHKVQTSQGLRILTSQLTSPTILEDLETASSQIISIPDTYTIKKEVADGDSTKMDEKATKSNSEEMEDTNKIDFGVAQDSEEDNDLYLSSCIICLLGFEEKVLRKLVSMIRAGGGTRHKLLSHNVTHVILGTPSEAEMKEARRLAAWGVVNVVNTTWLEESYQAKRELAVSSRHIFPALKVSTGSASSCMETSVFVHDVKKIDSNHVPLYATKGRFTEDKMPALLSSGTKNINGSSSINGFAEEVPRCTRSHHLPFKESKQNEKGKLHSSCDLASSLNNTATFKGKSFCFSASFPLDKRDEVIKWIKDGGGILLDDQEKNANFIIKSHGISQVLSASISQSTTVTTHWIRSSLEVGYMQDIANHILFSPLQCHIPLPGFEDLRFCVSQYDVQERILLRNLCYILGAKFTEKLTRKVTHLLCKFTNGPKYEAACSRGIHTITAEWLTECVSQDKLVPPISFQPRPVTAQDKEAGLCTVSQHPTQAIGLISFSTQSQSLPQGLTQDSKMNFVFSSSKADKFTRDGKKLKISECNVNIEASERSKVVDDRVEVHKVVPDVADAIEDLLAQSGKIQDLKSPGISGSESNIFAADHPIIGQNHGNSHIDLGFSTHWLARPQKQDSPFKTPNQARSSGPFKTPNQARSSGPFDCFSETQTDSQVVGYEEDLTGRQKIIERVRSQSLTLTPDVKITTLLSP